MAILVTLLSCLGLVGWVVLPWAIAEGVAARRERRTLRALVVALLRVSDLPVEAGGPRDDGHDRNRDERL